MADNIYLKYGESLSDAEFEAGAILFAKKDKAIAFDDPTDNKRYIVGRDGDVIGPDSTQDGAIPIFDGTTGKIIKDSNYFPSDFAKSDHKHSIIPAGTVTSTFTGNQGVATGTFNPDGDVIITVEKNGAVNYTPSGSVTVEFTPKGTISSVVSDLTEKTKKSINEITSVGTLPVFNSDYNVSNSTLTFNWNPGILPQIKTTQIHDGYEISKSSPIFTGETEITPGEFTGTGVSLAATFIGKDGTIECTFTPSGTIESIFEGEYQDTSTPN